MAGEDSRGWRVAVATFSATVLVALLAYGQTIASLVNVWSHSDTFGYGFLVAPTCVYLVWRARASLAPLRPGPYPLALVALIPLGIAWIAGRAASTLLIEQLSFVAMIPVLVCAFFGPRVTRRLAFPLCFLFFAEGDFPRSQEASHAFSAWLAIDIRPVFQALIERLVPVALTGAQKLVEQLLPRRGMQAGGARDDTIHIEDCGLEAKTHR